MKKKILLTILYLLTLTVYILAQSPGFNYQAVLRNPAGETMTNEAVTLHFSLLDTDESVIYKESQALTTDELGILTCMIGTGNPETGTFSEITGKQDVTLRIEAELPGTTGMTNVGESKLGIIPYALYGKDEDADPDNEMQTLSLEGDSIKISNRSGVNISSIKSPWKKTADGYELDLSDQSRNAILSLIRASMEGINLQNAAGQQNVNPEGRRIGDNENSGEERFGRIGDILDQEKISRIADRIEAPDDVVANAIGLVSTAVGDYCNVSAIANLQGDGFSYRSLGEAEFATWQIDGSCFQAHYIGGEKRGDFFYDGENDAVGMNFYPASSEVATGGILVNQLLSLAAFQTIAVLGPEAFLSLVTANSAGGDIITNATSGAIATRMTSIQDGGGVILVYDNDGQEKIRLGCDQSGDAGIWFGSERVLGGTAQAQLGPKVTDEGTIQLLDGEASVYYDKIFTSTSTEEKMVIALTPLSSESQGLAVVEKFNGGFKIKELNNGKGSYLVDWTATSKKRSGNTKKEELQKIEVPQRWSSMSKMESMRDIKKINSDNR